VYLPGNFSTALLLTILSTVFWGSWANTYKGTKNYAFELFYWDYILGVVLCSWLFTLTLGSNGVTGESFVRNLQSADASNVTQAVIAGAIFNVANLLPAVAASPVPRTSSAPSSSHSLRPQNRLRDDDVVTVECHCR
jgi:glucose uptake protein